MHLYGDFAPLILPVFYPLFGTRFSPPLSVFSQRVRCEIAEACAFCSIQCATLCFRREFLLSNGALAQLD